MRVPDWIVTLFHFNVQNADINSQLQDALPDMRVDFEAQSLFKRKKPAWQCHVNTTVKYPKFVQLLSRFYLHSQFPTCLNLVLVMQMHS